MTHQELVTWEMPFLCSKSVAYSLKLLVVSSNWQFVNSIWWRRWSFCNMLFRSIDLKWKSYRCRQRNSTWRIQTVFYRKKGSLVSSGFLLKITFFSWRAQTLDLGSRNSAICWFAVWKFKDSIRAVTVFSLSKLTLLGYS